MAKYQVLESAELAQTLDSLYGWKVVQGKLATQFGFESFRKALAFMNLVGMECEVADHHPEWSNVYNTVQIAFCTHDAGNQITDLDVRLARYASKAAQDLQGAPK